MCKSLLLSVCVASLLTPTFTAVASESGITHSVSTRLEEGKRVEVDHFNYEIVRSVYVFEAEKWGVPPITGWGAVMTGCADVFYMPSSLVVPDEITVDGQTIPVVKLDGSQFPKKEKVTSLTLGKNVKVVDNCSGFRSLNKVNFNDGLWVIEMSAFQYVPLTSVTFPNSLIYIGQRAFECTALSEIKFDNSLSDEYSLSIGGGAFAECDNLTTVTLPKQAAYVAPSAFYRNPALKEILVDAGCENLRSVDGVLFRKSGDVYDAVCYPAGKEGTFYSFPEILSGGRILSDFFAYQSSGKDYPAQQLLRFDFSALTAPIVIEERAIEAYKVDEIILENVDSVYGYALYLQTPVVTIGKNVNYIHPLGFDNNVQSFNVDDGNPRYLAGADGSLLERVDDGLRYVRTPNRSYIISYTIPDDVVEIGDNAFYFCEWMTDLTLSKNMRRIGDMAFYATKKLKKINVPGNQLDYISPTALYGGSMGINVSNWWYEQPAGAVYLGNALYRWKGETNENAALKVKEGTTVLSPYCFSNFYSPSYSLSDSKLSIGSVNLPSTIEKIHERAFYKQNTLTKVNIPDRTTFIGDYAFYGTALESVTVPENVEYIGDNAFGNMPSIKEIRIGSFGADAKTEIGPWAFSGARNAQSLLIGANVKSIGKSAFSSLAYDSDPIDVEIPSSVEYIGYTAFDNANISMLTIGAGLKTVGGMAFRCRYNYLYDEMTGAITGSEFTLKEIHIKALTPPVPESETDVNLFFNDVYDRLPLYVPVGKVADYKAAPGWSQFRRILNEGDIDAIEGVVAESDSSVSIAAGNGMIVVEAKATTPVTVVTVSGASVYSGSGSVSLHVAPGIYIVKAGGKIAKLSVN